MIRCFFPTPIRAIAVLSVCALTCAGCSREEQIEVYEESLANGAGETRQSTSNGGLQLQTQNPASEEMIEYEVPEGWTQTQSSGLLKVAFQLKEGNLAAEATAIGLPTSVSNLLSNVNRWRRQVGLENTTQEDLDAVLEVIEVGGQSGRYLSLVGPADVERPLAMLVVLAGKQDRPWFLKMSGDAELVMREKERFEAFVTSVSFFSASGSKEEEPAD